MGNTTIGLTFILFVNLILFLWQGAITDLNSETLHWDYSGTLYDNYNKGDKENPILIIDSDNIIADFPEGQSGIKISDGNIFTDIFKSIRSWFKAGSKGLLYIKNILSAPYNALNSISILPDVFVYAIGTFWYALTLFLIVSFIWGRE